MKHHSAVEQIASLLIITGSLVILPLATSIAQDETTILLKYKFKKGDILKYKTEQHDSTESSSANQMMPRHITIWSLKTLVVQETPPGKPYTISIKTDSTWTDQDQPQGGNTRQRRAFRMNRGPHERTYKITPSGKLISQNTILPSFIIPLSEKPIKVNETWDFENTIEQTGRRKGKTTINGQCLLYDIKKEKNKTTALIIVNAEFKSEGEFKSRRQQNTISGTFASTGTSTNLVYFDVDLGYVTEVVSEEKRASTTESTMFSQNSKSTSKSTVKLVSK